MVAFPTHLLNKDFRFPMTSRNTNPEPTTPGDPAGVWKWCSLVTRLIRDQEIGGSSPSFQTIFTLKLGGINR